MGFQCAYDEKDAVGRRYRRQDALGTPFCITVDHQNRRSNGNHRQRYDETRPRSYCQTHYRKMKFR
jgi:glycyl-tRNA synthetase (class II)